LGTAGAGTLFAPGACANEGRERAAEIRTRKVAFSEGISL